MVVVSTKLGGKDCPDFFEAAKNPKAWVFLSLATRWGGVVCVLPWIHWSRRRETDRRVDAGQLMTPR